MSISTTALLCAAGAQAMDEAAWKQWGLNPYALVEAAGRACAQAFSRVYQKKKEHCSFVVFAGKGNNAADALVMLRTLILDGYAQASACRVISAANPGSLCENGQTPLSAAALAIQKLGVPVQEWSATEASGAIASVDVIIDGIAGTGLNGPLHGAAGEMAELINAARASDRAPYIVSIDMPSGNFDGWQSGMTIVAAHATLAIEPQKLCLYLPAARLCAGTIISIGGLFPQELAAAHAEAERVVWESAARRIPPVSQTAYKYKRGIVEIRAGSSGATGAAVLAARGAQAAGAGLVRLIVDPSVYPIVAPACSGIMVAVNRDDRRFTPDAVLLGPGWGSEAGRTRLLESYLPREQDGMPLILDADAITLAKDRVFNGNAIITPHPGEFAAYTGLAKDAILADPLPALRRSAAAHNVYILLKSHVLYVAAPDGRIAIIDGMNPVLAAGGSGDVLAGLCASIAARWRAVSPREQSFNGYDCACAAASLLIRAAESPCVAGAFVDPQDIAGAAALIAGAAWLPSPAEGGT